MKRFFCLFFITAALITNVYAQDFVIGSKISQMVGCSFKKAHLPHARYINTNNNIITHIRLLHELQQHFRNNHNTQITSENAGEQHIVHNFPTASSTDVKLTQTEAYLSIYKSSIPQYWLTEHQALIDQIMMQERELSKTHHVFYHAHKKELLILQDFIKQLRGYMALLAPRLDFTFMRFKDLHAAPYKDVDAYLDAHPYINDGNSQTSTYMASVNLALFGNHNYTGECTFGYFLSNSNASWINISDRLKPIFSHYNFDKKHLDQLVNLNKYLASPAGNLLQIFIPHNMVDQLVYLARPYGMPYQNVVLPEFYDHTKKRHTCIQPLIEYMRTSPEKIDNLEYWQSRLMFFDPMFDTNSEIKIFQYNTVSEENMKRYQQEMKLIVEQIVADYLSRTSINIFTDPLLRLYHYLEDIVKNKTEAAIDTPDVYTP